MAVARAHYPDAVMGALEEGEARDIAAEKTEKAEPVVKPEVRIEMDREGLINGMKIRIRSANLQQLADIGMEIVRLDDDIKAALRDLYRARRAELDQVVAEA
jgi:hypothetical protein